MTAALDPDTCYRALAARDPRFDGRFFVAVATTGIYCRPVCTARTPRADRCAFYRTAAEAERAGFRACFRCRPELAPGASSLDAVPRLVARAVAKIDAGYLSERSLDDLAAELGVTARHLRRAVHAELGVRPIELAQTRRLALAKQLLADTRLSIPEVAFASGFGSIRRFNAAFRARFGRPPSSVRRGALEAGSALAIRLPVRGPLAWDDLLGFLGARAIEGVESIREGVYARTIVDRDRHGTVRVRRDARGLVAEVDPALAPALPSIVARLRALFDLDADVVAIDRHLARDRRLAPSIARRPGMRVPGAWDPFELAVRAIVGQRVSVAAATRLASRIAERFGAELPSSEPALRRAFPPASTIARAAPHELAELGLTAARARTIVDLARALDAREIVLEPGVSIDEAIAALERVDGIGPWTASYVAMRALRWPDAFLPTDLGVRRALGDASADEAIGASERWRPWRAYAVIHLWLSEGDHR